MEGKGKKILVLDENLVPYLNNKTSAFFLEWRLSRIVFEGPDYYQHVLVVAEAFEQDPPEIVMDPHHLMPGVLKYWPAIQAKYRREGNLYIRVESCGATVMPL